MPGAGGPKLLFTFHDEVIVAGHFQPESGFGLMGVLLRGDIGFPFHTPEEPSSFGAEAASL